MIKGPQTDSLPFLCEDMDMLSFHKKNLIIFFSRFCFIDPKCNLSMFLKKNVLTESAFYQIRSSGRSAPLLLAPVEGWGALWPPLP